MYAKEYQTFQLSADFRTTFRSTHSQGNYGLKIDFYTSDPDQEEVSFTFDISNFYGDFYSFTTWSNQSIVLQAVDKGYLTGLKKITLFKENFEPDLEDIYSEEGVIQKENLDDNIFVSNIQLQFVEVIDLTTIDYYVSIKAPYGTEINDSTITDTDYSLYLKPSLLYYGTEILDEKRCVVKWYKRRGHILTGVDGYESTGGCGWQAIPQANIGTGTQFGWLLFGTNYEQVIFKETYKLVVVYNGETTLEKEITVYNKDAKINWDILQRSTLDGKNIELYIADYNNQQKDETYATIDENKYVCNWYFQQPDKTYTLLEGNLPVMQVSDYLLQTYLDFWCDIKDKNSDTEEIVTTLYYRIKKANIEEDLTVDFSVTPEVSTFRYDVDGNYTIEESEKNRGLGFNLTWAEGSGTIYSVRWYMKDGNGDIHTITELVGNKYQPINSMIDTIWIADSTTNLLNFTIKSRYKNNYVNNTVYLEITDKTNQKVYLYEKTFIFVKDGDQGTNGTPYVALIRYCDSQGKVYTNSYNAYQKKNNSYLTIEVYNDGVKMKDGYAINSFTANNIVLSDTSIAAVKCLQKGQNIDLTKASYVKAEISIQDNQRASLYPIFNIDIADDNIELSRVDISNITSSIAYTVSGVAPSFNNTPLNYYYKNQKMNGKDIQVITSNLLSITTKQQQNNENNTTETLYYLTPVSEFLFKEQQMGLIQVPTADGNIYHSIVMSLNVYGNEAINGWDGTSIRLDEKNNYLFAPVIGAGKKEAGNIFTGVVMGQAPDGMTSTLLTGIYGYERGINTFGLLEDGRAYFGAQNTGRITIEGKKATIYGGQNENDGNNMVIRLSDLANGGVYVSNQNNGKSTKAIEIHGNAKLNNNVFYVDYSGYLKANAGTIAGWTMDYVKSSESTTSASIEYLTSSTSKITDDIPRNSTTLLSDGRIYCKYLDASERGIIGGWAFAPTVGISGTGEFTSNALVAINGYSILDGNGHIGTTYFDIFAEGAIGEGPYKVTNPRKLTEDLTVTKVKENFVIGRLGFVTGNDGAGNTANVGLQAAKGHGIVFESGNNMRFSTKIHNYGSTGDDSQEEETYGKFFLDCPAENQFGVYARFA